MEKVTYQLLLVTFSNQVRVTGHFQYVGCELGGCYFL